MAGIADPMDEAPPPTTGVSPPAEGKMVRNHKLSAQQRSAKRSPDFRGDRQDWPPKNTKLVRRLQATPSDELVAALISGKLAGESAEIARGILWQREAEAMARDTEKNVTPATKLDLVDWTTLALVVAIGLLLGIILATSAIDYLLG